MAEDACWICFENLSRKDDLVRPCRCSLGLIHHECLQKWVNLKFPSLSSVNPPSCPQCKAVYSIQYPKASIIARAYISTIDIVFNKAFPLWYWGGSSILLFGLCRNYGSAFFQHVSVQPSLWQPKSLILPDILLPGTTWRSFVAKDLMVPLLPLYMVGKFEDWLVLLRYPLMLSCALSTSPSDPLAFAAYPLVSMYYSGLKYLFYYHWYPELQESEVSEETEMLSSIWGLSLPFIAGGIVKLARGDSKVKYKEPLEEVLYSEVLQDTFLVACGCVFIKDVMHFAYKWCVLKQGRDRRIASIY